MRKILILLFFISTGYVHSQTPGDIITDRPDQTESTDILQPGYVQIEGGFANYVTTYDNFTDIDIEFSAASISGLVRIGVFPNMELRIAPEYAISKTTTNFTNPTLTFENKIEGFTPLTIGTKIKIVDESEKIPAMSFLFHVDIPKLASENFKSTNPTPEVRFAFSKTLSDRFSLGVNLGAYFSIDYQQTVGIYTAALGADIVEKLGGFIEVYGFMADHTSAHIDGGLTYLIMKNLQVDVFAGTGLTIDSEDFSFGGGLSVRLPR